MKIDPATRRLLESWPGATITGVALPARLLATRSGDPRTTTPRDEESTPGRWVMNIPGWSPTLLNRLMRVHFHEAARMKRKDADVVAKACLVAGVTPATGKRRVGVTISGRFRRLPDPDGATKSLFDALVRAGAIVDDCAASLAWSPPVFERGEPKTVITLEDLP